MTTSIYENCTIAQIGGEIRLLQLSPAKRLTDPIQCSLATTSLESVPEYTALSYVWGDATLLQPISVNGCLFGITPNLHAALCYIRNPTAAMRLWVDAICINQNDADERNEQVAQMHSVFARARRVIAWLGEPDEHSNAAIDYLAGSSWHNSNSVTAPERILTSLAHLFSRPYWARVWVIQEVATASHIAFHCGHKSLSLISLQTFMTKRVEFGFSIRDAFWRPRRLLRIARGEEGEEDEGVRMLNILREAAKFEATVPVDKVYGLLGLFPADVRRVLRPDYYKSFRDAVFDLVRVYTNTFNNVEFLGVFPKLTDSRVGTGYPSWMPDIRTRILGLVEATYAARREWEVPRRISVVRTSLSLYGVVIGQIMSTYGPFSVPPEALSDDWRVHNRLPPDVSFTKLKEIAIQQMRSTQPNSGELELEIAFFNMISGDRVHYVGRPGSVSRREVWNIIQDAETSGSADELRRVGAYFAGYFGRLSKRKFLVTSSGLVGLGPMDVKGGDIVCVVYGCRFPIVLREVAVAEATCFSFVGPAYVHGAMSGEFARSGTDTLFEIV